MTLGEYILELKDALAALQAEVEALKARVLELESRPRARSARA